MDSDIHAVPAIGRREFLLGLSVAAVGSPLVRAETGRAEHTTSPAPLLPTIHLGEHRITRLIAGSNPISGYSYVGDASAADLRRYLLDVGVDFLSPHRLRRQGCAEQTAEATRQCFSLTRKIGRIVPVNYQEPFRRDFSPKQFQPTAEDFATDLRGAIEGGAAAWCFHNGDNQLADGGQPRRSFDMHKRRLFDQLDQEERKAIAVISRIVKKESLA